MVVFYNIGIWLYRFMVQVVSPFNAKAKLWITGRKNVFAQLKKITKNDKVIWFHVSSLGEFEQGRPVIEKIKLQFPDHKILLTFFSPSGYEIRKNYTSADIITYLPVDTKRNATKFLKLAHPELAFFVKYEFWFHYLNQLNKANIPTYIFSAIFRNDQLFFKPYGKWYRNMLHFFKHIYVQNQQSLELLQSVGIEHATIGGDTRFDRVLELAQQPKEFPLIEQFCQDESVLIAGSTWEKDEQLIADFFKKNPNQKWIITPHEIHDAHIQKLEQLFGEQCIRYTQANTENVTYKKIFIIDTIGMLSSLYQYGLAAYIGGGFGVGIHNTLEAITYGIPVVFGPNYKKFQEAKDILSLEAGFTIKNSTEFINNFNRLIFDQELTKKMGASARKYVAQMSGGTIIILNKLTIKS